MVAFYVMGNNMPLKNQLSICALRTFSRPKYVHYDIRIVKLDASYIVAPNKKCILPLIGPMRVTNSKSTWFLQKNISWGVITGENISNNRKTVILWHFQLSTMLIRQVMVLK